MSSERAAFVAAIEALQPYMRDLVIVGGWVPLIYHHSYAEPPDGEPPGTTDVDVVLPPNLAANRRPPLHEVMTSAGYTSMSMPVVGESRPRLSFEKVLSPGVTSEVELLTPAKGGRRGMVEIGGQRPLTAEALPFHNLLLENTLELTLMPDFEPASMSTPLTVSVPRPAPAFLYAKGLTWHRRATPAKQIKDLTYLVDLIMRYPSLREEILDELPELMARYPASWRGRFRTGLSQAFDTPGSAHCRAVAQQLIEAGLTQASRKEEASHVYAVVAEFQRDLQEGVNL